MGIRDRCQGAAAVVIVACVSGHGYGHGSRVASVLTALHALEPDWRLVLSTALPRPFLELALGPVPFEHRDCRWDVGVIQADALGADGPATLSAVTKRGRRLRGHAEGESRGGRSTGGGGRALPGGVEGHFRGTAARGREWA